MRGINRMGGFNILEDRFFLKHDQDGMDLEGKHAHAGSGLGQISLGPEIEVKPVTEPELDTTSWGADGGGNEDS